MGATGPRTVCLRSAVAALAVFMVAASTASGNDPPTPPFRASEYWQLADGMMSGLDVRWRPSRSAYVDPRTGIASVRVNSSMLVAHAVAALEAHTGATRQDARARVLARRLSATPVWLGSRSVEGGRGTRSTCWGQNMHRRRARHPSLEPKVAAALTLAWRARRRLELPSAVARRIERRVSACARSRAWRYPPRVVNQINWNAEMYAAAATVSGDTRLLTRDYRRMLAGFAAAITRPTGGKRSPNLGRGYQFHYRPDLPDTAGINLDSPEYASIVLHAVSHYDRAVRLGMRPLPRASLQRLRAWGMRVLAGAWTHGGYLNWDTGKGYDRWHSAQYWAFAQQGLLSLATSPRFWLRSDEGRWAKAFFDAALQLHRALADANGSPLAPPRMFGVPSEMEAYDCFCSRQLATIARAIAAGLGSLPTEQPPPLYAFDYDTGRLAVTTPRYSTAIVPDNRGIFHYGGIDPARLFGPGQRVAANIGGKPPAAFGVVVADLRGKTILSSQRTRSGRLRLTRSPRGNPLKPRPYPLRPYAGPFGDLEASGIVRGGRVTVRSSHRFSRDAIRSRWRINCIARCEPHRIRVHFPSAGRRATVDAILHDGSIVRLAGEQAAASTRPPLSGVRELRFSSSGLHAGGYRVTPLTAPRGSRLVVLHPRAQKTNPAPGPTLAIEARTGRDPDVLTFTARIRPTSR